MKLGTARACADFLQITTEEIRRILNMTSMLAHFALPGRTAYCTSKAGLLGMTKALALELASYNITVNAISPGPFATKINEDRMKDPAL